VRISFITHFRTQMVSVMLISDVMGKKNLSMTSQPTFCTIRYLNIYHDVTGHSPSISFCDIVPYIILTPSLNGEESVKN